MKKTMSLLLCLVILVGLVSILALNQSARTWRVAEASGAVRKGRDAAPTPFHTAPTYMRPHNCANPGCSDVGAISVTQRVQGRAVNDEEVPSDLILLSSEAKGEAIS